MFEHFMRRTARASSARHLGPEVGDLFERHERACELLGLLLGEDHADHAPELPEKRLVSDGIGRCAERHRHVFAPAAAVLERHLDDRLVVVLLALVTVKRTRAIMAATRGSSRRARANEGRPAEPKTRSAATL